MCSVCQILLNFEIDIHISNSLEVVLMLKGVIDLHLDISTYLRRKLYKSGYIIRCIVDFNCHKIRCMVGSQVIGKKWPVSVEEGR